jgi:V-type H+-transporting ATPase subunit D
MSVFLSKMGNWLCIKAKRKMGRVMQLASFSMAEVTYATGDISYLVQEQAKLATFRVKAKQENVSGVVLPAFEVDRVPGSGKLIPLVPSSLC